MTIMQGPDLLFWFAIALTLTILSVLFTWYMVIIGRGDTKPRKQRRGEEAIEHFPGGLQENRAPLPKFIFITIVGAVIWSLAYLIWTGFAGLGY